MEVAQVMGNVYNNAIMYSTTVVTTSEFDLCQMRGEMNQKVNRVLDIICETPALCDWKGHPK
jgi:hypothetical protein